MDTLKQQQQFSGTTLNGRQEPSVTVIHTKVENALKGESPLISVADQLTKVVKREFDKIKADRKV